MPSKKEETNLERVKLYLKKNYKPILIGVAIAGFTCAIMRGRHARTQSVPDGLAKVTMRPLSFLSSQVSSANIDQSTKIINVIEREGRGHPGYLICCKETGKVFLSQIEVATDMNSYPSVVSNHLTGKLPDINGYHFERIGVPI